MTFSLAHIALKKSTSETGAGSEHYQVTLGLNWKTQHAYAAGKGTNWAAQIKRLSRPTWGITPKLARRLYISVALPRTLYAADVWCRPTSSETQTVTGSAKLIRQLTTIQRSGVLAITGGLRSSPTDALDTCAYLTPAALTAEKWGHSSLVRMAMLPAEHPLHGIISQKTAQKVKRHKAPINYLLGLHNLEPRKVEKIPSVARNPSETGRLPFNVRIADDRDTSVEEAANAPEEIKVFIDGSAINGKVGAAAILTRAGNPLKVLHAHLGLETEHTVHKAELVGILLGMHLIKSERHGSTACMIGVDNQAALKAFQSDLRSPGHHIAREIIRTANQIQKKRGKTRYSLMMRWTAGHEGVEGNEEADREAKKAAEGHTTDKKSLPSYLRKPLPLNPAAIKRAYNEKLKARWTEKWINSERGKRAARIEESTPSKKFLTSISKEGLSREAASRIAQLRLAHVPTNSYLRCIGRVDSARCPACGASEETPEHFLLSCPSYAHERWALAKQAKKLRKSLSMGTLLGEPEMIKPLANYIAAMHRFSHNGEHSLR